MSQPETNGGRPPVPQPRAAADDCLSVGVEEEFLLVDPASARIVPLAPAVLAEADGQVIGLQAEITTFQVETATRVCDTMPDLRAELHRSRATLGSVARAHHTRLVAAGAPVLGPDGPVTFTPNPRYLRMVREYRRLAYGMTICGCHVHVGVPDDDAGVLVCNHLRAWLPTLLAVSANSPFSAGRDTGYASWRYLVWTRWPTAGPPPWFESAQAYHDTAGELLSSGAAGDPGMLYWDVRLSARHPTVELRVCAVAGTADEAVLLAALVRGIAGMALDGAPVPRVSGTLLRAALWQAARDGMTGEGIDLASHRPASAALLLAKLVDWLRPALTASGDLELVRELVRRVVSSGGGAARQRAAYRRRGELVDVVDLLADQTAPADRPAVRHRDGT